MGNDSNRRVRIKTGLIGGPLGKSLSPRLFRIFSGLLGEKFDYALKEVRPGGLGKALDEIKRAGWRGFNVTLPLKERVLPFLSKTHGPAAAIGAVNAVLVRDGRLEGYNTDAEAFLRSLGAAKAVIRGRTCVIWGAGGAAKAAAWALATGGAAGISVHNRSPARARALTARFSRLFPRVKFRAGGFLSPVPVEASVFVNATPLGMYGPLPEALKAAGPGTGLYCDFAYGRGVTPFLKGRSGGTITGLDLLICQALAGAALWTGRRITATDFEKLKEKTKRLLYAQIPYRR